MSTQTRYVTTAHEGWPVEQFLVAELPDLPREMIRRMLRAGDIRIDRETAWLGRRLRSGERVIVPAAEVEAGPAPIPVLLEDDVLLVVDKPAGTPVIPDRALKHPSLIERMREAAGEDESRYVVHRIDMEASGVVVLAKTAEAHRELSRQFEKREVEKRYLAIVAGEPDLDEDVIELPIGHDPRNRMRMRTDRREGKLSRTMYRVVERFRDHALVEARPETGRTHQIRVHLAGIGHPLAVDKMYGSRDRMRLSDIKPGYRRKTREIESALIDRLTLHARELGFTHPVSGERVTVGVDVPDDFALALKMLRKFRPPRTDEDV